MGMGRGLVPQVSETPKTLVQSSPHHHPDSPPIQSDVSLFFHCSFTTVFLFGMKSVILRYKNRMKNVIQLHHPRVK